MNNTTRLKIFSDKSYLIDGVNSVTMLFPFWKEARENHNYPWDRCCERYAEIGHSLFEMTSLEEADLAVMPIPWVAIRGSSWAAKENKVALDLAIQFAGKVEKAGKQVVVDFSSDASDEEIPIKNALIFRQSLYRSRMKRARDFAFPAWIEDIVESYLDGQLPIRQKCEKPVVGFCGHTEKNSFKTALQTIRYQSIMFMRYGEMRISPYVGHSMRAQFLPILSRSPAVETNFIEQERSVFISEENFNLKQKARLKYVRNMVESDYIFCCRGAANYSIRIYEALCCGRIPIFIDTDCVLPYDFAIDWKKYCVWVDEKELPQIAEKVAEFHNNLSPQEFVDLQHECRRLWKEWLSPEGFYANFYRHFQVAVDEKAENTSESETKVLK